MTDEMLHQLIAFKLGAKNFVLMSTSTRPESRHNRFMQFFLEHLQPRITKVFANSIWKTLVVAQCH